MRRVLRRGPVVLACLLAAVAVLGTSTRTWLRADLTGVLAGTPAVDVAGAQAAPLVPAVALVGLAAAAAVSIAGRVGRLVAGAVLVLAGGAAVTATLGLLADPVGAASARLAMATAGTGVPPDAVSLTGWPALALVPALLLSACGATVVVAGRRWDPGRRFETADSAGAAGLRPAEPVSDWDALTAGVDPTATRADSAQEARD